MSEKPSNAFWEFSLRVYRQKGVPEACLQLQDRFDADVNLVLYFCWLASRRAAPLDAAEVDTIVGATADWRDGVVRPLRKIRRRMKEAFGTVSSELSEPLRSEVKRVELESERLQQVVLFERATAEPEVKVAPGDAACNAMTNLERYFNSINADIGNDRRIACETIVTAAFAAA